MASVEFDVSAGSPRMSRTANVPTLSGQAGVLWIKITSYENWLDLFSLDSNSGEWLLFEADNAGDLRGLNFDNGPNHAIDIWLDGRTSWQCLAWSANGSAMSFWRRAEGETSWTSVGDLDLTGITITPGRVLFGASDSFAGDGNGTIRYGLMRLWSAAKSSSILLDESASLTPIETDDLTFSNDCQSAATIGTDQSSTGGNCTVTGTPTDSSDAPNISLGYAPLVAVQGSYALTGQAVALERGYTLACAQGSITATGQTVALRRGYPLALAQGSYALTGQDVTLTEGGGHAPLAMGQGSYALTGQDVALAGAHRLLFADGAFSATGQPLSLRAARLLGLAQGSYAATGQSVELVYDDDLRIALEAGGYDVTGQAVALRRAARVIAEQGAYALAGQVVELRKGVALALVAGSYALTGQDAAFSRAVRVTLDPGSYALAGQAALLKAALRLALAQGSYAASGQDVAFRRGFDVNIDAGAVAVTGHPLAFLFGRRLPLAQGDYDLTGSAVDLRWSAQTLFVLVGRQHTVFFSVPKTTVTFR